MRTFIFTLFVLFFFSKLDGQEFAFTMYFVDAIGQRDSLVMGYDPSATDTIDELFKEKNIIDTPWTNRLDVRISDEWFSRFRNIKATYHSKKWIPTNSCDQRLVQFGINVSSKHWPILAYWDKKVFQNECLELSRFRSFILIGGDVVFSGESNFDNEFLNSRDSIVFTANYKNTFRLVTGFINNAGDTISNFWVELIGKNTIVPVQDIVVQSHSMKSWPNPASTVINFQCNPSFGKLVNLEIYSMTGKQILTASKSEGINISTLSNGIYLSIATNEHGWKAISKFVVK